VNPPPRRPPPFLGRAVGLQGAAEAIGLAWVNPSVDCSSLPAGGA
jgi:hypothetical protein